MNKKVKYAIRMYKFHYRLLNKYLRIILEYLEDNGLTEEKSKRKIEEIIEGQVSIFDKEQIWKKQ